MHMHKCIHSTLMSSISAGITCCPADRFSKDMQEILCLIVKSAHEFHWGILRLKSCSTLSPHTCKSFLPCSMVGNDKPGSIPLFCLCLQTRKLGLDGFVNQRPLFLCIIFHLHISGGKRTGYIRIFSDIITRSRERKHTSIDTLLSLFLKSWSSPSCFFCSSVSTSDSCGTCGTSGTSYHKENTTVNHKSTLQHMILCWKSRVLIGY